MAVVRRCLGALAVVFTASISVACAGSGATDDTDVDAGVASDAPSGGPTGNDGGPRADASSPGADSAATDTGAVDHDGASGDSAIGDGAIGGDTGAGGAPAGQSCQKDSDCASALCK